MTKVKYISRAVFFLLMIALLVHINKKPDNNTESVAEFKFKMFQKMTTDSLDSKHKVDLLVNETTKFIDDSSHVRQGMNYLVLLFVLIIITEVVFVILERRNSGRQIN